MSKTQLALLYTEVVELRDGVTEGGRFEMPVEIDMAAMLKSGDPRRYFFREIGVHLRAAIEDTEVPKDYWWVQFGDRVQQEFNLPQRQSFRI